VGCDERNVGGPPRWGKERHSFQFSNNADVMTQLRDGFPFAARHFDPFAA
jgi:hypothetical protein